MNEMLVNIKALLMLSMLLALLNSCSQSDIKSEQARQKTDPLPTNLTPKLETISELNTEQQSAFDALNALQVNMDEMNRIYSTFAGIDQPCYPPDTSFTISQSELLMAMKHFVTSNCRNLTDKKRNELATFSVLAQKEYTVSLCQGNLSNVDFENGIPMKGTWVLLSVLNRRDVIIVW